MLETVREYALEKLAQSGELAACATATPRRSPRCWPTSRTAWRPPSSPRLAAPARRRARQHPRRRAPRHRGAATPTPRSRWSAPLWRYWVMRGRSPRAASSSPARWRSAAAAARLRLRGRQRRRASWRPRWATSTPPAATSRRASRSPTQTGARDREARVGQQPRHPRRSTPATSTTAIAPLRGGDRDRARARRRAARSA